MRQKSIKGSIKSQDESKRGLAMLQNAKKNRQKKHQGSKVFCACGLREVQEEIN